MHRKHMIMERFALWAGLLIILSIVYMVIWRPSIVIRAELARIKAEGAPLTMKDLEGKKIPDSENAALVYKKAFIIVSDKKMATYFNVVKKSTSPSHWPLKTVGEWNQLRSAVSKFDSIIPIIENATSMPKCKFAVNLSKGPMFALYRHASEIKKLGSILSAKALMSAKDKKMADSMHYLALLCKMSQSLKHDNPTIHLLIRMSLMTQASRTLQECLKECELEKSEALILDDELARFGEISDLAGAFENERAQAIFLYDQVREVGPHALDGEDAPSKVPFEGKDSLIYRLRANHDEMYGLMKFRELIESANLPYRVIAAQGIGEIEGYHRYYAITSILCLSGAHIFFESRDQSEAKVNIARIALALSVYKRTSKSYPRTLNEIAGFFKGKFPIDPFSGRDFIYKKQGNGYLLYSIGSDLKDNGGWENPKSSGVRSKGDIVWKVE